MTLATVIVAFLAKASCSIAVGRENEATVWNGAPVIATAATAELESWLATPARRVPIIDRSPSY